MGLPRVSQRERLFAMDDEMVVNTDQTTTFRIALNSISILEKMLRWSEWTSVFLIIPKRDIRGRWVWGRCHTRSRIISYVDPTIERQYVDNVFDMMRAGNGSVS